MENKVVLTITRRDLVSFFVGAVGVAGLNKLIMPDRPSVQLSYFELADLVSELAPPSSVRQFLSRKQLSKVDYLANLHTNLQRGLNDYPTMRVVLEKLIEEDNDSYRVVFVDGWVMTHTEVALGLLA